MTDSAADPKPLVLDEEEQITLTGLLLMLMNDDLEALQAKTPDSQRLRLRRSRRNQLRFERTLKAEGRGHHEELDIEHPGVLGDRLAAVRSAAHALQLLVSAAAHQPYLTAMPDPGVGRLSEPARHDRLTWAVFELGLGQRELDRILDRLDPKKSALIARRAAQAVLLGGAVWAGVATVGVAAPAIGAAVGGTMGLSGAAATSAGLATLGGGSLAAGGYGMAGGTALIGALGGVGGAGLGALIASGVPKGELAAQAAQLAALIHAALPMKAETRRAVLGQGALIEIEVGSLIAQRAKTQLVGDPTAAQLSHDIEALSELRRVLPMPHEFDLP